MTAKIDAGSKPLSPGRRISNTPLNPITIATQRLQPTRSPKNTTAPAATTSGVACRMAEADDSGVNAMASV